MAQRCFDVLGAKLGQSAKYRCARIALAMARLRSSWRRVLDSGYVFLAPCKGQGWKLVKITGGPVAVGLASSGAFVQVNFIWTHMTNAHSPQADAYGDLEQAGRGPSCFRDPEGAKQADQPEDFSAELPTLPIIVLPGFSSGSSVSVKQGALLLYDMRAGILDLEDPEQLLKPPLWTADEAGTVFDSAYLERLRSVPIEP
jgi:hypothetical protein